MDWGKAKTVLIIAFVLLNVLLGYQLWSELRAEFRANQKQAELPADKVLIMQQKNITLAASLPIETPKMGDITYLLEARNEKAEKEVLLEEPVDSSVVFNNQQLYRSLGNVIAEINDYAYDVNSSSKEVSVFNRIVNGKPMFFTRLLLFNSNLKITAYSQDRVEIIGFGEEKTVLAASKIITSLVDSYLEENSVIIDIQLGYYGQIFDSDVQVATPAWRVMLDDAKVYYVDALSGEVLTDHADQVNGVVE